MKKNTAWLLVLMLVIMSWPIYGDSGWTKPIIQSERTLPDATFGQEYYYELSVDGGVAPYTWELYEAALPEGLSISEQGVISGIPTEIMNKAFKPKFKVTDSSGKKSNLSTGRALFRITVLTEKGEIYVPVSTWTKPVIQSERTLPDATLGQEYYYELSVDGGVAPYTWELYEAALPEGLTVSEQGVISGIPTEIMNKAFKPKIKVTDSSGKKSNLSTGRALFRIMVLTEEGEVYVPASTWTKPIIQSERTLPDATLGQEYHYELSVDGGVAPYTWELYEAALPEGLTISEQGVISGIPTEIKNKAFKPKIKVTDSSGKKSNLSTGRALFRITVVESDEEPQWLAPSISTSTLPTGKVNEAYDFQLEGQDGTEPYTWTIVSGTLPEGLALSEAGQITGRPVEATIGSVVVVTIQLQDSSGKPSDESTDEKTLSITIDAADPVWIAPSITSSSLPTGKVNEVYNFQLQGQDGTTPYVWSIAAGTLPEGLVLSDSGHITGTPVEATVSTDVTIQLQDSSGKPNDQSVVQKVLSIIIEEADVQPPVDNAYYVSPDGSDSNPGTLEEPFETIPKAISMITTGGEIILKEGTYTPSKKILISSKNPSEDNRIIIRGVNKDSVTVKRAGTVFITYSPYITIQDLTLDGDWGNEDILKIGGGSDYFKLDNVEVMNTRRDAVDMSSITGVRINNCKIHDAIWVDGDVRRDAHGIVTGGVHDFKVTSTEIYYVSGDALQFQYGGWDNVTVEDCTLWNGPLPTARGGAPAGVYPGENAIDTKHYTSNPRGRIYINNVTAYGWKSDYITNAAAFNMKHHIEATFDGVTVYDSDIGFRLRGPGSKGGAIVTLKNAVLYDNQRPIRYEDDIIDLHIYNVTFGTGNASLFQSAGGYGAGFEVKNCLFTNGSKPSEANDASNMVVDTSSYTDASNHNYHLANGSLAINAGTTISEVTKDRDGNPRDSQIDIGAYEK